MGNDDDNDAAKILLAANKLIMQEAGPPAYPQQPLGEFMSPRQLEGLVMTFHAIDYLANRAHYARIADELRGYLVIE